MINIRTCILPVLYPRVSEVITIKPVFGYHQPNKEEKLHSAVKGWKQSKIQLEFDGSTLEFRLVYTVGIWSEEGRATECTQSRV